MTASTREKLVDPGEVTAGVLWSSGLQFAVTASYQFGTRYLPGSRFTGACHAAMLLTALLAGIMLPVWAMRVRTNAELLRPGSQQHTRRTAGWAWFVPVVCLWQPFQVVDDAWHAGTRDGKGSWIVELWWYARIAALAVLALTPLAVLAGYGQAALWVWFVLRLTAFVAGVRMTRQLDRWQREDIARSAARVAVAA
jgi:hypothetical protein